MKKEFNLSEKRIGQLYNNEVGKFYYPEEKVKEAVRLLKEDFSEDWTNANGKTFTLDEIRDKINKIFGDKLI